MQTILETLESRRLLAGHVSAELNSAGDLVLTGDNRANQIAVAASTTGFAVTGVGTSVTSSNPAAVPIAGGVFIPNQARDLKISLANGDDNVSLSGSFIGDITIDTGNGNDVVALTDGSVNLSDVDIDTGSGNDEVRMGNFEFFDQVDLAVDLGKGNDTLTLTGNVFVVLSAATIDGGGGIDTIANENFLAPASSTIDLLHIEQHVP